MSKSAYDGPMTWLETSTENCTVQRTLDLIGEKWSLLVLRDAMNGVRRFDDFRRHVGLSEAVLADRLRTLVGAGSWRPSPTASPAAARATSTGSPARAGTCGPS